jgi:hypothetical protein
LGVSLPKRWRVPPVAGLNNAGRRRNTLQAKRELVDLVLLGKTIDQALDEVGRTRSTYDRWRKLDPDYAALMDEVRTGLKEGRKGVPDFPEFCDLYLHQPLTWHQLQWYDMLEGHEPRDLHPSETYEKGLRNFLLINTPPEHAKTTTISINYCVWRICKDPNVRIVLVSKTDKMAQEWLFAIKSRLTHPRWATLQMAFGPPGGWRADADVWTASRVYLARDSTEKDPTVQTLGIGGQIYGARADLIVCDDCIVLSNAHQFEPQLRWIQQEVLTRINEYGRLLVVGTRVDSVDLYKELRNPERYPSNESPWTYLAQPAVLEYSDNPKDWKTLWPRNKEPWQGSKDKKDKDGFYPRWDGPHLSRRRSTLAPKTWAMAYQQANVEEDSTFDTAMVRACINGMRSPGRLHPEIPGVKRGMTGLYIIGSMDPAMVGDTGVIVMGVDRGERKRWVLDGRLKTGATPQWIRQTIKELTDLYGIHEWRIERNAFQAYLVQDPEIAEWLADRGIRLSEHTTGRNKWDVSFGVASMAPLFEFKLIDLPSTSKSEPIKQLVEQLITWSPETKAKTDMVMALWFAHIRALEIVKAAALEGGPNSHVDNRFLSRRGRARQVTINLNDLAAQKLGWSDA